jgi:hypothetical protein
MILHVTLAAIDAELIHKLSLWKSAFDMVTAAQKLIKLTAVYRT